DRLRLAAVGTRIPTRELAIPPPEDFRGSVRRSAVLNAVLEVGIALVQHASNRSLDEIRLVIRRRDDGDPGSVRCARYVDVIKRKVEVPRLVLDEHPEPGLRQMPRLDKRTAQPRSGEVERHENEAEEDEGPLVCTKRPLGL